MTKKMRDMRLADILNEIDRDADGDKVIVGDLIERLNSRGFGPLLLATGLIGVLPTGAIPGAPIVIALVLLMISFQMLFGKQQPWIPQKVKNLSFPASKYKVAKDKMMPGAKFIDKLIKPRLSFLTHPASIRILAILCMGIAIAMPLIGLIPFAMMVPSLVIVFLGLGLSAHDGALILCALIAALSGAVFLWPSF